LVVSHRKHAAENLREINGRNSREALWAKEHQLRAASRGIVSQRPPIVLVSHSLQQVIIEIPTRRKSTKDKLPILQRLVVAQSNHWIDSRGAQGRQETRETGDRSQQAGGHQ
jgi:hypothetical protein